jgi:hypothetical protein
VRGVTAVANAPDLGERYLDTIYQSNWVEDLHGPDVLNSAALSTAPPARLTRNELSNSRVQRPVDPGPALGDEPAQGRGLGLVGCQAKGTERNPPK